MNETKQSTADLAILDQLNKDYIRSDQFNDEVFSEFLAEDFIVQTPAEIATASEQVPMWRDTLASMKCVAAVISAKALSRMDARRKRRQIREILRSFQSSLTPRLG
jgi:hypothetical protein